ncbi:hypothetical protein AGABI2DRAFT_181101, partial [Agaricus bisporus var. bisporus H97]|uniref:hypothetical protein n=1 Tax=Agaricus bisporus var. bisporus (strain H97 / ATCC MYA-4626 / FGSC 10389) TaxID=936046 RepID=UPI00029F7644
MKLSTAFGIFPDLWWGLRIAFWPTCFAIWQSPGLLLQPQRLSQTFFTPIWDVLGAVADQACRPVKEKLITPYAYGTVLDLGAGFGHTMKYLDRQKITKYVALEPNIKMHDRIRAIGAQEGYKESDGSLLILPYGVQDSSAILSALDNTPFDTIISILTLCSIPSPQQSITNLIRDTLKPGGLFLYYEHVLSPKQDVAFWQRLWTPLWAFMFDGCRLDRPSHLYIDEIGNDAGESIWKESNVWGKEGEPEEHLHWHRIGRYIKA